MKKAYYYLLYRMYRFYADQCNEKKLSLYYTSAASSVLLGFNGLILLEVFYNLGLIERMSFGKLGIVIYGLALWILSYFFFVRKKSFLKQGFKKDFGGGVLVITYFAMTLITFIVFANINREKIFKERRKSLQIVQPEKPSLEGKIRRWLRDKGDKKSQDTTMLSDTIVFYPSAESTFKVETLVDSLKGESP